MTHRQKNIKLFFWEFVHRLKFLKHDEPEAGCASVFR